MFGEPKYKYLSDIISLESTRTAVHSSAKLIKEFAESRTRDKKLRIARAANLASNRALAMLQRGDLSLRERNEFREIAKIYRSASSQLFRKL